MYRNQNRTSVAGVVQFALVLLNGVVLEKSYIHNAGLYKLCYVTIPLLLVCIAFKRKKFF